MMSPKLVSLLLSSLGSGIFELIRLLVLRNVWAWQDLQPDSGPNATFFEFCDALEVKDGVSAPASGWGLAHALPAWGNYFKTVTLPDSKPATSSWRPPLPVC